MSDRPPPAALPVGRPIGHAFKQRGLWA